MLNMGSVTNINSSGTAVLVKNKQTKPNKQTKNPNHNKTPKNPNPKKHKTHHTKKHSHISVVSRAALMLVVWQYAVENIKLKPEAQNFVEYYTIQHLYI